MVPRSLKIKVFEEPRSPYGGRHLPPTPEVAASSGIDAEADIALASLGWMEPNNAIRRQVCLLLALSGHRCRRWPCPLLEVKRTPRIRDLRSANDPTRTSRR